MRSSIPRMQRSRRGYPHRFVGFHCSLHTPPQSRGAFRPSFAWSRAPRLEERAQGRPRAGWLPWPPVQKVVCVCRHRRKTTGQPGHPGLPCAVGLRLMSCSPRGALHYCPRHLAADDTPARSGRSHHRKAWRQTPGRQDHTILPYTHSTCRKRAVLLTVARPAKPLAPMGPVSTAVRPHVVTIAIRPLRRAGVSETYDNSEIR